MVAQPKSKAHTKRHTERVDHSALLTLEEIEQLRAWALKTCQDKYLTDIERREGALTVALLGTGARRFEMAAMTCADIRRGPGGPEAHFPTVKGGGTAVIPISTETFEAIEVWIKSSLYHEPNTPLIPTEAGEFMHPATLWLALKRAFAAAGIKRQTGVHSTRHAAGFLLLRATGDLTKVQTFLRHRRLATTANWYQHVHMPDLRAALEKARM